MSIVKWYKNQSFQLKLVIGYLVLALIPMLCVTWYSYEKPEICFLQKHIRVLDRKRNELRKTFPRWQSRMKRFWMCCMWTRC